MNRQHKIKLKKGKREKKKVTKKERKFFQAVFYSIFSRENQMKKKRKKKSMIHDSGIYVGPGTSCGPIIQKGSLGLQSILALSVKLG